MNKYRNTPTIIDGIRFASKREAKRYQELKLLVLGKEIINLVLQPRFKLVVNGQLICTYVGDFQYFDYRTKRHVLEDVKGLKTDVYEIKKKLMKAIHKEDIVEV